MSISVLNNISSIIAENAVSNTQSSLQTTLEQLSTGLRINSGADDPAGLSIAQGLGANIAALTQSSQNATDGIGVLQTADGALSQVNTILNQAVTIATEASNGGLSSSQSAALNTEFQAILTEINQIGSTTNFNGTSVFAASTPTWVSTQGSTADPLATSTDLTAGSTTTITDAATGGTFVFTAAAGDNVQSLATAITNAVDAGTLSSGTELEINSDDQVEITNTNGDSIQVSTNDAALGTFGTSGSTAGSLSVFTTDGTTTGSSTTTASIGALSATSLGLTSSLNLSTATAAQTALTKITDAINTVSQNRGDIGAAVNALTSDSNVETTEVQNLTSAQNNIQNANIATVTSNLAQYNILEQTGFDALSQSQSDEQNVLKLLQ
jgi:flagellin